MEDVILVAEEVETDQCTEPSVQDVVKIVRSPLDPQPVNQSFVASVLRVETMVEVMIEEITEATIEVEARINFKDSLPTLRQK